MMGTKDNTIIDEHTLLKVLDEDGRPIHGGTGTWHLPQGDNPGAWMTPIKDALKECVNGYHLCKPSHLIDWLGPAIYIAEYKGDRIDGDDKIVVRQARLVRKLDTWNDTTARLFACDCAERALALVPEPDPRSLEGVRVARRYALGEASDEELAAARNAANVAWVARAANAASAASGAAASAASGAAMSARDARAAERAWQTERLMAYLNGEVNDGQ